MNRGASKLGQLARGVPKTLTPAALAARRSNFEAARKKRWPHKKRQRQNDNAEVSPR